LLISLAAFEIHTVAVIGVANLIGAKTCIRVSKHAQTGVVRLIATIRPVVEDAGDTVIRDRRPLVLGTVSGRPV
jgi:hypothetical protein